jgi:hypothetical protein
MNWLSSPLAATAVVLAILAALAIPLRKLTAERVVSSVSVPTVEISGNSHGHGHVHEFPGVLRVRLLDAAESLQVRTVEGVVLWEAANLGAGEHEVDADLLLIDDALELFVKADFGVGSRDTALFLTVIPEGVEEMTHYAIGSGSVEEVLHFEWDLH